MEPFDDDYAYQAEVSKSIYIMCGVVIVFLLGLVVERNKPAPVVVETKNTV